MNKEGRQAIRLELAEIAVRICDLDLDGFMADLEPGNRQRLIVEGARAFKRKVAEALLEALEEPLSMDD